MMVFTAYRQFLTSLLTYKKEGTALQMINVNIDSYDVIIKKLIYGFRQRIYSGNNLIVNSVVDTIEFPI